MIPLRLPSVSTPDPLYVPPPGFERCYVPPVLAHTRSLLQSFDDERAHNYSLTMSSLDPQLIQTLVTSVDFIQSSRYVVWSALTLALYDWALLIGDEFETVWQTRWTFPKILYFFIRIITPPCLILCAYHLSNFRGPLSTEFCRVWIVFVTIPMLLLCLACNWLFTLRLLALYRRNAYAVWFLRIGFALTWGTSFSMLVNALVFFEKNLTYNETLGICGTPVKSVFIPAVFYSPLAFEGLVLFFTLAQAYKDANFIISPVSTPFLTVLYRDGMICFVVMLAMRSWNIWIYVTQPLAASYLGFSMMWAMNAVVTTRIYLNIVWLAKDPVVSMDSKRTTSIRWVQRSSKATGISSTMSTDASKSGSSRYQSGTATAVSAV